MTGDALADFQAVIRSTVGRGAGSQGAVGLQAWLSTSTQVMQVLSSPRTVCMRSQKASNEAAIASDKDRHGDQQADCRNFHIYLKTSTSAVAASVSLVQPPGLVAARLNSGGVCPYFLSHGNGSAFEILPGPRIISPTTK